MCYTKPFDYTYLKEKSSVLKRPLHTKSLWNATTFEFSTKKIFTLNVLYKTLHTLDKMLGKVILFSLRKQRMIILYTMQDCIFDGVARPDVDAVYTNSKICGNFASNYPTPYLIAR